MKIKNVSNGTVVISDLPGAQTGQGMTLHANAEKILFNEDAEKSTQLRTMIDAGIISVLSQGEEPTDGSSVADVDAAASAAAAAAAQADATQALADAATADGKAVTADGKAVTADGKAVTADGKAVAAQSTADDALPTANLLAFDSSAGSGGAASEAMTVTGILSSDTILSVTQKTKGANGLAMISYSTLVNDGLTVEWTADPGAGAVVTVSVKR